MVKLLIWARIARFRFTLYTCTVTRLGHSAVTVPNIVKAQETHYTSWGTWPHPYSDL